MTAVSSAPRLLAECHPFEGMNHLPNISLAALATLQGESEANKEVETTCSRCGEPITAPFWLRFACACEPCAAKHRKAEAEDKVKAYWEHVCPPAFRDTDIHHNDFPSGPYEQLTEWHGEQSLLFYGPERTGKSRLGMMMLNRCLVRYSTLIGCMWPEQLKAVKFAHDRLEMVQKWGRYDLLMMDDFLLTGAQDERISDFCKDLLDYRMRHKRIHIITSQIGGDDYEQQAEKFGEGTKVDKARIKSLLGRIRETSRVIAFTQTKPVAGEAQF